MKVLVIGGGLGGLCLAHGLAGRGIDVRVFERDDSLDARPAGYGLHLDRHGLAALQACLTVPQWSALLSSTTPAGATLTFRDERLRVLARRDDGSTGGRRGISRTDLRRVLCEGLGERADAMRWGRVFTRYESLADGRVRAHFADGSHEEGDVLVGADASHSAVRRQYLPAIQREDLHIVAIAGRYALEPGGDDLPAFVTNGELTSIAPASGGWMFLSAWNDAVTDASRTSRSVVWAYVPPRGSHPAPEMAAWPTHALRAEVLGRIDDWDASLKRLVKGATADGLRGIPLRTMPHLPMWSASPVTLLGDAIHNMTPMAGIGANTALRDAQVLAHRLGEAGSDREGIVQAIAAYEDAMRDYANRAVAMSRRNAEQAATLSSVSRALFRGMLRLANASPLVMRHTIGRGAMDDVHSTP